MKFTLVAVLLAATALLFSNTSVRGQGALGDVRGMATDSVRKTVSVVVTNGRAEGVLLVAA